MELKRAKVVMLPTVHKTDIGYLEREKENRIEFLPILRRNKDWNFVKRDWKCYHIYIISDEKIQKGDWSTVRSIMISNLKDCKVTIVHYKP